jgi:hypothetical protein
MEGRKVRAGLLLARKTGPTSRLALTGITNLSRGYLPGEVAADGQVVVGVHVYDYVRVA